MIPSLSATPDHESHDEEEVQLSDTGEGDDTTRVPVGSPPVGTENIGSQRPGKRKRATVQDELPGQTLHERWWSPSSPEERLMDNITKLASDTPEGVIPQRPYSIAWGPIDVQLGNISFMTTTGEYIPAQHALRGDCVCLLDKDGAAFGGSVQTISIRIQWPGYDGWARQMRTVNYQAERKSITRARLAIEIAKILNKFIEDKKSVPIDPAYMKFKVGPGGIELRHVYIVSLDQVSRGSWQPCLIYKSS